MCPAVAVKRFDSPRRCKGACAARPCVELCREYHVEESLRPLLEYDMSPDGSGAPAQGSLVFSVTALYLLVFTGRNFFLEGFRSSRFHNTSECRCDETSIRLLVERHANFESRWCCESETNENPRGGTLYRVQHLVGS
jgi:hypothetical protein